jgi:hypothetical protein
LTVEEPNPAEGNLEGNAVQLHFDIDGVSETEWRSGSPSQ